MWQFFLLTTCRNLGLLLTIIMDNGYQYFEKKIMSKNLHNATCHILIYG
jgi:hypothetical protein